MLCASGTLKKNQRGTSIIEFALLMPWYFFLVVGAFDLGFYMYALIATQNAARVGALYCSSSTTAAADSDNACSYALDQLRGLPNVGTGLSTCLASPLTVTASLVAGPDSSNATSVQVTYTTPQLVPIPGLLPGVMTISRTVIMAVRS
ncbi:MAG TPA: TadE/TadG family type IV pilus assembly protein [Bryobacteraceae bacterium]|nr:TadE/TadG family type IV pilus assembly protein [Bryobacteraceae bacterium]